MHTSCSKNDVVLQKTLELCQVIVAQPEFQTIRRGVEAFMADQSAQAQYHNLSEKGRALHHKQHQGLPLDPVEISTFEKERESFFANPIAKGFVDAQEQMHQVQESISQHVLKTYELGRTPTAEDFESHGCCGRHEHGEGHEHGGEGCECKH